jgi:hypothetical protein
MAKDKDYTYATGDKVPRSPDAPFHSTKSGFTHPVEGLSNNITGIPPDPGMRGNTHGVGSEPVGRGKMPTGNNVMTSFFMDRGEK